MRRPIVLDASAALPLVHQELESDTWRSVADRWILDRRRVVVPDHFWLEVVNSLLRRHQYTGDAVLEALHVLGDVVVESLAIDRPTLLMALDRAERFGLTAYDAAYLALAEAIDAELATMDGALAVAAGDRLVRRPGSLQLSEPRATYGDQPRATWPDYREAASYLAKLRAEVIASGRS